MRSGFINGAKMSDCEDVTYSRTDTIAAVSDYYKFLIAMYMDDSQVVYPPPGGWPSIVNADPDVLGLLGKSDEVLSLLAHLPYIPRSEEAEVGLTCFFADWPDIIQMLTKYPTRVESVRVQTEGDLGKLEAPHVVGLTSNRWDESLMVLDTEFGLMHWQECPFEIVKEYGGSSLASPWDDDIDQKEFVWREDAVRWAIPEFFEILKDQFKKLNWIPISPTSVRSADTFNVGEEEKVANRLRDIYRQHGWPDLGIYRKSECLEAVDRALADCYPET